MRKKGILVVLLIITFLTALLAGTALLAAGLQNHTDRTDPQIKAKNVSLETAMYHHLSRALQSIDENGQATIRLELYDINEILYALCADLNFDGFIVKGMYIEQQDDGWRLCVPVQVSEFPSLLSADIRLYEQDRVLCVELWDFQAGNITIPTALFSALNADAYLSDWLAPFHMTAAFTDGTLKLALSRADLGLWIGELTESSAYQDLVETLYSILMLDTDAVAFHLDPLDGCAITVDLGRFDGHNCPDFDTVNAYSVDLLQRGVIAIDQVGLMAQYYINGYMHLTEEEQSAVLGILSAEQTAEQTQAYAGLVERENLSLTKLLLTQFEVNPNYLSPGFKIADGELNSLFSQLPCVGTVWQYASHRDNTCGYILIQSLYVSIGDDQLALYMDLNLNGYVLTVCADLVCRESPVAAITGQIQTVSLGSYPLGDENLRSLYDFLCDILQADWLQTDRDTLTLTMDFERAFQEDAVLTTLLKNSRHIVTVCKDGQLMDGGYVQITISLL